jgi:hypothetical protein
MITQKDINNACEHLKIVATVSDDLIEFMREASIVKLTSETQEDVEIDKDVKMLNKKFGVKAMEEIAKMCIGNQIGIDDVADFVNYRNKIKKPLKTERPLKIFIQELIKIKDAGYDIKQSIEIMMNAEWQTLNIEWIAKKIPKQAINSDLTQFGFEPQDEKRLIR